MSPRTPMKTFKLLRLRGDKLYPLYVEADRVMVIGEWMEARVGELADPDHMKSRTGGRLALRPGFHSTLIPFTDWIGRKAPDGRLYQRKDTVWCECEVRGKEQVVTDWRGLKVLPSDWYYYKTNSRQKDPWIISNGIRIIRILSHTEVGEICKKHGLTAQPMETVLTEL